MTTKINGLPSISTSADVLSPVTGRKPEAAKKDLSVPDGDSLELTAPARLLSEGSTDAPMDAQRVDKLRQAIADGSYRIDADRIAAKLLEIEHGTGKDG
jgi:negative regulator of flagellin synthesis FlgM